MTFEAITQYKQMLKNLQTCMKKAEEYATEKKFEADVLCGMRLAPDMFNFTKQIQSVCDIPKFTAAYLSEQKPPVHEDTETTWKECQARIQKVITYLDSFKAADFKNGDNVKVSPKWAKGKWIAGSDYIAQVSNPNFYFHMNMAYALLRHSGAPIGKMDYLGELPLRD